MGRGARNSGRAGSWEIRKALTPERETKREEEEETQLALKVFVLWLPAPGRTRQEQK